jgi:hypothetical protein
LLAQHSGASLEEANVGVDEKNTASKLAIGIHAANCSVLTDGIQPGFPPTFARAPGI